MFWAWFASKNKLISGLFQGVSEAKPKPSIFKNFSMLF
jgi:hypothetical protein